MEEKIDVDLPLPTSSKSLKDKLQELEEIKNMISEKEYNKMRTVICGLLH